MGAHPLHECADAFGTLAECGTETGISTGAAVLVAGGLVLALAAVAALVWAVLRRMRGPI